MGHGCTNGVRGISRAALSLPFPSPLRGGGVSRTLEDDKEYKLVLSLQSNASPKTPVFLRVAPGLGAELVVEIVDQKTGI